MKDIEIINEIEKELAIQMSLTWKVQSQNRYTQNENITGLGFDGCNIGDLRGILSP